MRRPSSRAALLAAALCALLGLALPAVAAAADDFDIQAHRGGIGLRPESTLASFGNALRLGVTTLELDVQITEDGVAVVTHDRRVSDVPCDDTQPATPGDPEFPYVGKYVNALSFAQVRTLDCGTRDPVNPATDRYIATQVPVPGARMPTLREVFELVQRYGADDVTLNVETKVEAGAPTETAPREQFVQVVAREVREAGMLDQVTIQSFDWGALMRMREVEPRLPIVALTNGDFLQVGRPGASPWLGGIDIDDFGGDLVAAVASFGADALSPVHGNPQAAGVEDEGYVPYTTKAMVDAAHARGIEVIPWTINDRPTMEKLIDDGVDGIITDFPDRLREVLRDRGHELPEGIEPPFDVQGHRGARAVRPENTLAAFRYALANEDVSTLELDAGITQDGQVVVIHDRRINGSHCVDTRPARRGDREFPYVGDLVRDLTLRQLKTLDCGSRTLDEFPRQRAVPGARVPTLDEVMRLVEASGRDDVRLNLETKISPTAPEETVGPREFTRRVVRRLQRAGFVERTTLQSFDWRTLRIARRLDRRLQTVALVWQYGPAECRTLADECSLQAVYGDPSVESPWTAGVDWWDLRDLGAIARRIGASTVSANWQVHDPDQPVVEDPDWYLRQDPRYFHGPTVPEIQEQGVEVVPYTINDEAIMQRVIDLGVDGIITDDPDLLVLVARRNGLR